MPPILAGPRPRPALSAPIRMRGLGGGSTMIATMPDLLAARPQMAMSLGFHIIFAVVGIGMPLLMVVNFSLGATPAATN